MSDKIPLVGFTNELEIERFLREWAALSAFEQHCKFAVSSILPDSLKIVPLVRLNDAQRVIDQQAAEIQRLKRERAALEEQP